MNPSPTDAPCLPRDIRPGRQIAITLTFFTYLGYLLLFATPWIVDWLDWDFVDGSGGSDQGPKGVLLLLVSWLIAFGLVYLYGALRVRRLPLFTPRARLAMRMGPLLAALALALWLGPTIFGYAWFGIGICTTWGLAWSESTAEFLPPGPVARWAWRVLGIAWPLLVPLCLFDAWSLATDFVWDAPIALHAAPLRLLLFGLPLLLVCWRSHRARRAARAWVAATYPAVATPDPEAAPAT